MRHEEKYCIWSGSSIGGCPLEEASEQERIPSIIGSIVWCFPTLKGLMVIKEILNIVLVYLLWCFCIQYWILNKWYQSTFLGQTLWANIFYFCRFFFGAEKREPRHSRSFQYIFVQSFQGFFCGRRHDFFFFLKLGGIVRGTHICNMFEKIQPPIATKIKKNHAAVRRKNPENFAQKYTENFENVAALFFLLRKKICKNKKYLPTMSAQGKCSDTTC